MTILEDIEGLATIANPMGAASAPGGATLEQIEELVRVAGNIPAEIKRLLLWRNGSPSDLWLGEGLWFLLSASDIGACLSDWRSKRSWHLVAEKGAVVSDQWPENWVPFATWNGDIFAVLDSSAGSTGSVVGVDIEGGRVSRWTETLDDFLALVRNALAHGSSLDVDELMGYNY